MPAARASLAGKGEPKMPKNHGNGDAIEAKILSLKERVEKAKAARARAEAEKEMLERRLAEVEDQIRALGVEPDQAEEEIRRLDAEIGRRLAEAEELLRPFEELLRQGNG